MNYNVAANTGPARTGTLTVAGQTFAVSQETGACSYAIHPSTQAFGAAGGSGTLTVTAGGGCPWTAASSGAWLTIPSGASGTGNGTVAFSVAPNTVPAPRTGTLTVAGQSFTVTQEAAPCTFSISPLGQSFGAGGGTGAVSVTAAAGCAWVTASNALWITITSGNSGSGNGTVNYSVAAHSGTTSRTGTLTIAGQSFTVTESAPGGSPRLAVSPTYVHFGYVSLSRPASRTITVSNNGTAPLTINPFFTGQHPTQFKQTHSCPTIAPGSSCNLTVTFAPTSTGSKNAYLVITSNDPVKKTVYVYLAGRAVR